MNVIYLLIGLLIAGGIYYAMYPAKVKGWYDRAKEKVTKTPPPAV